MAKTKKEISFVQAAIPLERGVAKHFEHDDEMARTVYENGSGRVKEIHTPPNPLKRVHEVMHARHTRPMDYPGVRQEIYDIVEDCRLHIKHWPWGPKETPDVIQKAAIETIIHEVNGLKKLRGKRTDSLAAFADFATRLRANSVAEGLGLGSTSFSQPTMTKNELAATVAKLIRDNNTLAAAAMIETVFFGDEGDGEVEVEKDSKAEEMFEMVDVRSPGLRKKVREGGKAVLEKELARIFESHRPPKMEIVELALQEPTKHTSAGFRLAKTGSRLHRPSLRRPILPQRIFWRRSPELPAGAILFDGSGSMDVSQETMLDCCIRAPAATVAYYAGNEYSRSPKGTLWIFAKDGMRARKVTDTPRGNAVDGPALDWLMAQDGPKIFVTDRGFCGANDSIVQLARLEHLENLEEVKVYPSYDEFKEAFPIQEAA